MLKAIVDTNGQKDGTSAENVYRYIKVKRHFVYPKCPFRALSLLVCPFSFQANHNDNVRGKEAVAQANAEIRRAVEALEERSFIESTEDEVIRGVFSSARE